MTKCAVYCRISRDATGNALGVARQEGDCRAKAEGLGWTVVEVLADNDVSAYSGKRRPGYERLLTGLAAGEWKGIVAWHPDRITRSPVELEGFIDAVERARAKITTVQAGEFDLATAAGRMQARVVGAVARHESEHKSARLRAKHRQLAEHGQLSGGGTRPFGYLVDRVTLNDVEAVVIRDLARRFLAGETLRSLCAGLNDQGVTTPTGKPWAPYTMRRMFLSPRIAGLREHRGRVAGPAVWPGIIDESTHRRLVALLTDPARRTNRTVRRYLLTGIARCGLCGAKVVARPRDDGRRSMVCATGPGFTGCGKLRVLAEPLEQLVASAAIHRLSSAELSAALKTDGEADDGTEAIVALEDKLAELGRQWARGEREDAFVAGARRDLERQLDDARRRVVKSTKANVLADLGDGLIADLWPELTLDRQRAILDVIIESVVVNSAVKGRNRFDAERIDVRWRA
jgi:site-specific DNA recombinase